MLNRLDFAVKIALISNSLTLTPIEQQAAQYWLGIQGGSGIASSLDSQSTTERIEVVAGIEKVTGQGLPNKYVMIDSNGISLIDNTDPQSPQLYKYKTWDQLLS